MTKVTRRRFVQGSTALATAGGMAGILATRTAPAYAQATTVHWLRWNDFVPASDQLLRRELLPEGEKALGVKINFETVNANDLQPRITSAIQSGAGPDLIMLNNNHPQLYAESVVDMADLVAELAKSEGVHYPLVKANSGDGGKWLSMPWAIIGGMIAYRKSWFEEVGAAKFPESWEQYREVGKKLKAKGRPIGQTLGHTFGDAPTFAYPYLWSWGGKEVEADGKTVAINSKESVESVKFMAGFWKDAHDEGGLAWDDTNNNRAFLSQTISATLNGASIYIESLRNPDKYVSEKGAQLKTDIQHSPLPKGPAGQFSMHTYHSHVMPSYSKNQKAAKEFLKWAHSKPVYEKWFISQKGFATPTTPEWEKHKVWDEDPVMAPYKVAGKLGLTPGYAGPSGKKAGEALSKYIIVDMYAKAVQGMPAEEAVKWAEGELKKVYG
ncbi:MAG TPA: extracellular solute-binding protein [Hyphomicrobiaceae bacterium]|jgi:multiple sugar transport system substrate-binding protein|nr:extracellular solute-binding protein [Hyphomicrobiaceae bacterium]